MRAVLEGANVLEIIKERIAKAKRIDGKGVVKANDEFFRSERVGVNRKLKANRAGQDFLRGQEAERFEMAKEAADQEMRPEKGTWSYWGGKMLGDLGGILPDKFGTIPTEERWKMDRADRTLMEKARKVGLSEEQIMSALGVKVGEFAELTGPDGKIQEGTLQARREWLSGDERRGGFNQLSTQVERAQGNPNPAGPDITGSLKEIAHEARETNRILREKGAANFVGPPRPAPPPPLPPVRGAAAPKRP